MGFDLYFAGSQHKESDILIKKLDCCKLQTQLNRRDCLNYIQAKKNGEFNGKFLVDSGAFTVHTKGVLLDIDKYIEFINDNIDYIDLFIQVDHIPGKFGQPRTFQQIQEGAEKSWQNYLYMRTKVKNTDKLLPVFHQDEDFKYLRQMLNYKDENGKHIPYICISSSKDKSSQTRFSWYAKVFETIELSANPNVKTHSLGTSSIKHLEYYPFTSSDATSWLQTAAMGNIFTKWGPIYISNVDKSVNKFIGQNDVTYDILKQYVESYGFDLNELKDCYYKRSNFNIVFLKKWSDNYVYKGPKSFKTNKLF